MVKHSLQLDAVFSALADPTRRKIVERLTRGALTVGEISAGFSISPPAITKHVRILEDAHLLEREIIGRTHRCRLAPRAMRAAATWLAKQERYWEAAFDRLEDHLAHSSIDSEP